MIPPDYKALETEVRMYETHYAPIGSSMRNTLGQVADALSLAASLQDEIERLKGYVRHAPDCHIATDGNGEYTNCYRPLGGCSCGLTPETGAT